MFKQFSYASITLTSQLTSLHDHYLKIKSMPGSIQQDPISIQILQALLNFHFKQQSSNTWQMQIYELKNLIPSRLLSVRPYTKSTQHGWRRAFDHQTVSFTNHKQAILHIFHGSHIFIYSFVRAGTEYLILYYSNILKILPWLKQI